jgi:hypothetical protein
MAVTIAAFQDGDLTKIAHTQNKIQTTPELYHVASGYALSADCLLKAFDDEERIHKFKQRYKGNKIVVDGRLL